MINIFSSKWAKVYQQNLTEQNLTEQNLTEDLNLTEQNLTEALISECETYSPARISQPWILISHDQV